MRMRTLELPSQVLGPAVHTPFVIVVDRFGADEEWNDEMGDAVKESTGAYGVVAFTNHEVELCNDIDVDPERGVTRFWTDDWDTPDQDRDAVWMSHDRDGIRVVARIDGVNVANPQTATP